MVITTYFTLSRERYFISSSWLILSTHDINNNHLKKLKEDLVIKVCFQMYKQTSLMQESLVWKYILSNSLASINQEHPNLKDIPFTLKIRTVRKKVYILNKMSKLTSSSKGQATLIRFFNESDINFRNLFVQLFLPHIDRALGEGCPR